MKVLISDKLSQEAVNIFQERGIIVDYKPDISRNELINIIQDYDGLAIRSNTKVDKEILSKASKLKIIGRAGIGVDNVDVDKATLNGVIVMNTPHGNSITTAEHTIAMIMSLARKIPDANQSTKKGKWEKTKFIGTEVTGKYLGLIGCGNIGSIVADRAKGLKMKVLVYDPFLTAETSKDIGVEKVSFDELLENSDIISIHTPLTNSTRNIINSKNIFSIKKGSSIINCARGGLIDENSLSAALKNKHLSGAAIDVFLEEPAKKNILFDAPNVILTPHLGASTKEAQEKVAVQVAEQISDYLLKGSVINSLNSPSISAEEAPVLKPYIKLSELLGNFLGQVKVGSQNIISVKVEFDGNASKINKDPIIAAMLCGLLKNYSDTVNMVNSLSVAVQKGLEVSTVSHDRKCDYQNLLRVTVKYENSSRTISGTLIGNEIPRITEVQGIPIEANFAPKILYVRNYDKPGFIGSIGTLLAKNKINIGSFHLGRRENSGEAIAILSIDQEVNNNTMNSLLNLEHVVRVDYMKF